MPEQPPVAASPFSREQKLRIAKREEEAPGKHLLNALAELAGDVDEEIRRAATTTLAALPVEEADRLLGEPSVAESAARCLLQPEHLRPELLGALLGCPVVPRDAVEALAAAAGPEALRALLSNLDRLRHPELLALQKNPTYQSWQQDPPPGEEFVLGAELLGMLIQEMESETAAATAPPESVSQAETPPTEKEEQKKETTEKGKPEGLVSKIAKMTVAQRVQLALRGGREERSMLIRDGSKVVSRAVLNSPRLTDSEIENFASLKNVNQEVLRLIALSRKFMKNYIVVRNLVYNPRLPIDVGLTLLPRMLVNDLRALSINKDISDTVRKMAIKLYKARTS